MLWSLCYKDKALKVHEILFGFSSRHYICFFEVESIRTVNGFPRKKNQIETMRSNTRFFYRREACPHFEYSNVSCWAAFTHSQSLPGTAIHSIRGIQAQTISILCCIKPAVRSSPEMFVATLHRFSAGSKPTSSLPYFACECY